MFGDRGSRQSRRERISARGLMDTGTVVLVAIAVAAGGLIQGLGGLGFALVAAPVVTQVVPGTTGIGLVNALSIVQNLWLIARTDGRLAWVEVRRMLPRPGHGRRRGVARPAGERTGGVRPDSRGLCLRLGRVAAAGGSVPWTRSGRRLGRVGRRREHRVWCRRTSDRCLSRHARPTILAPTCAPCRSSSPCSAW